MNEIHTLTDRGLFRTCNEDCAAHDQATCVAVLADGMGGHNAGEVASHETVRAVLDGLRRLHPDAIPIDAACAQLVIQELISDHNARLFERAGSSTDLNGMGCTLVVVWVIGMQAVVAHVGDSRCYHWKASEGLLLQITRDHTFVQFQLDHGLIEPSEVGTAAAKNYLTRSIGTSKKVKPDFHLLDLSADDVLVSCSDGLTEAADSARLAELMPQALASADPAKFLVDYAKEHGSRDNITVQVLRVVG
jgi:PPM family protein phosphatase